MSIVLIVEDDLATNNFYASILSHEGFTVVQATSYGQATHYLQDLRPHVILLDMSLPDSSGLALLDYLKGRCDFQCTRLAVVSGSVRYREEAERAGVTEYLQKPVLADALCECVQRLTQPR
jgi:DNA-binding NtrC family response regulator